MKVSQAPMPYLPVTIVLETQDDYDQMEAILLTVAKNRPNHMPQVVAAALDFHNELVQRGEDKT